MEHFPFRHAERARSVKASAAGEESRGVASGAGRRVGARPGTGFEPMPGPWVLTLL